jgi:hypothetical protein
MGNLSLLFMGKAKEGMEWFLKGATVTRELNTDEIFRTFTGKFGRDEILSILEEIYG